MDETTHSLIVADEDADEESPDVAIPDGITLPTPEVPPPWERQLGESAKAFHAFCHYRDLNSAASQYSRRGRSYRLAYHTHKQQCDHVTLDESLQAPKKWQVWSVTWGWVDRVGAWDDECDRQARAALLDDQIEARKRHANLAQATLTVLSVPVRATVEALQDPQMLQRLIDRARSGADGSVELLSMVGRLAALMPGLITAERVALGMAGETYEVTERRGDADTLANRIVRDPRATELAIALLDQLAGHGLVPADAEIIPGELVLETVPTTTPDD